jgi:hypothetical protein
MTQVNGSIAKKSLLTGLVAALFAVLFVVLGG